MSTAEIRQWVKNNMYFNSITGDWEFEEDTDPQELLDLCPDQVDTFEFEDSDIRSSDDYCGVLLGMLGSKHMVATQNKSDGSIIEFFSNVATKCGLEFERKIGLRPCPFCGKPAKFYALYDGSESPKYHVMCSDFATCPTGACTHYYNTQEEAAQAWNTRKG